MKIENWNGHDIRFVWYVDQWIGLAMDVAAALRYSDTNAMTRHMKGKYLVTVKLTGANQDYAGLTEQGIYKAITRSQRPEAEEFEDWIFNTIKTLREATSLEGFQVFRMMDKDHQKTAMLTLDEGLKAAKKVDYIKANTIANKAISTKNGYPKMVKKDDMPPDWLPKRQEILDSAVELMILADKHDLDISVSDKIYKRFA